MNVKKIFKSLLFSLMVVHGHYAGAKNIMGKKLNKEFTEQQNDVTEKKLNKSFAELQIKCLKFLQKQSILEDFAKKNGGEFFKYFVESGEFFKFFVEKGNNFNQKMKEKYNAPSYFTNKLFDHSVRNFGGTLRFYLYTTQLLKHALNNKLPRDYRKSICLCCSREIYPKMLHKAIDHKLIKVFSTLTLLAWDDDLNYHLKSCLNDLIKEDQDRNNLSCILHCIKKYATDTYWKNTKKQFFINKKPLEEIIKNHLRSKGVKQGLDSHYLPVNAFLESLGKERKKKIRENSLSKTISHC